MVTASRFVREINCSEGFPNMVLSTEYSEAVNARYTFQPLWVSDNIAQKDDFNSFIPAKVTTFSGEYSARIALR